MAKLERELRAHLFAHLDGLVLLPTLAALQRSGVHVHLLDRGGADVDELAVRFEGNAGYLNVALRLLATQGLLDMRSEDDAVHYALRPGAVPVLANARCFASVPSLVERAIGMGTMLNDSTIAAAFTEVWSNLREAIAARPFPKAMHERLLRMAEGLLAGPLLVHLAMHGARVRIDHRGKPRLAGIATPQREAADVMLGALGWVAAHDLEAPVLSEEGAFFAQRASAYGVTVSYLRTLARLDDLLFGDGDVLWRKAPGRPEIHVDRTMNVWGSGGAHGAYFKRMDELVLDLFNRPIEEQPRGFADMGSGNGALITHLFDLIHDHTLRGTMLREHPLCIVGADYNEAAQRATRANLDKADVWGTVMFGDVSDPARLASDLREQHGVDLGDLLNLRTFIDHNRLYREPEHYDKGRRGRSTGAFAFRGRRLRNRAVEQDLCDHLRRWTPYLQRFGLIVIELHTLPPALAAAHHGRTAILAYDGTHGYSDQYIVEHEVFLRTAAEAGLVPVSGSGTLFPSEDLPVISVNWLKARG